MKKLILIILLMIPVLGFSQAMSAFRRCITLDVLKKTGGELIKYSEEASSIKLPFYYNLNLVRGDIALVLSDYRNVTLNTNWTDNIEIPNCYFVVYNLNNLGATLTVVYMIDKLGTKYCILFVE